MAEESVSEKGNPLSHVPVEITVSVGKAHPKIQELLALENEAVLMLDKRVEDPVELYVGEKLIAMGELQEMEGEQAGQLAVRLTQIADVSGGL